MGPHRVAGLGLSFFVQAAFLSALISAAIVVPSIKAPPPIDFTPVEKIDPANPPPPKPIDLKIQTPSVAPPVITLETALPRDGITTTTPQRPVIVPVTPPPPVQTVPDRAAVSIAATHSAAPYPPMARRLGAEGKVTLRLTVLADGKVGRAEIVTSSGRRDFDEAAQSWIVAHWTYQPAIKDGVPAASQALAAMVFSLTNP